MSATAAATLEVRGPSESSSGLVGLNTAARFIPKRYPSRKSSRRQLKQIASHWRLNCNLFQKLLSAHAHDGAATFPPLEP